MKNTECKVPIMLMDRRWDSFVYWVFIPSFIQEPKMACEGWVRKCHLPKFIL